jgi:hypothetical protein
VKLSVVFVSVHFRIVLSIFGEKLRIFGAAAAGKLYAFDRIQYSVFREEAESHILANTWSESECFCQKGDRNDAFWQHCGGIRKNLIMYGNFKFNFKNLKILDLGLVYY